MSGISSKAAGKLENKKSKYNGYELNTDFDLNIYETFYRTHDPQLGRFWQLDPKAVNDESPYVAMGDNPVLHFDILGDDLEVATDKQSKDDINDLTRKKNQKYIKISDAGTVTIDFGKKSQKKIDKILANDEGLALVNDLIGAKEKYLYEASEIYLARVEDGSKGAGSTTQTGTHGIMNASEGGNDDNGQHRFRPKAGYDGQVVINPRVYLEEYDANSNLIPKKRSNIVFHELAENYYRTTGLGGAKIDYNSTTTTRGAHDLAVDKEMKWNQYSPSSQPGAVKSFPIPFPTGAAWINYKQIMTTYMNKK
jgi:RHS repeat-associated protein